MKFTWPRVFLYYLLLSLGFPILICICMFLADSYSYNSLGHLLNKLLRLVDFENPINLVYVYWIPLIIFNIKVWKKSLDTTRSKIIKLVVLDVLSTISVYVLLQLMAFALIAIVVTALGGSM